MTKYKENTNRNMNFRRGTIVSRPFSTLILELQKVYKEYCYEPIS